MNYQETTEWMFARLPMYQQKGASAYSGKLAPVRSLVAHLGHPEQRFKSIHIAGTNGKGSSSHMLSAVLQEAGYKVGLYTSPHLKDFRERIKINGDLAPQSFVVDFISQHKEFIESHQLSFFELTVGMALDYFAQEQVDIAVIEVGLGGRLDATNIITPEISLITNIGWDHMDLLGHTLVEIAAEKAGIIKSGVPVVISQTQDEVKNVFLTSAQQASAPIVFADQQKHPDYLCDLQGSYQKKNIQGVLSVLHHLAMAWGITDKHIRSGLGQVQKLTGFQGRWQVLSSHPTCVADTAHNVDGLTLTQQQLQSTPHKQLHLVLGFVKDKDLSAILPLFPKKAHYYFCAPQMMRALSATSLRDIAQMHGLNGSAYESVNQAFETAKSLADTEDLIYVGGSTFVVAEVV
ncbi:MAG: bifunctional folylpolyglutamate synthase/dihydrofolate synthase [Flavobacteriaceae bacterium]